MRPGLVIVGAAFLLTAAVSGASMFVLPPPPADHLVTTEIPSLLSLPNQTGTALLSGTNASDGSFELTWQSSGAVSVALYRTLGCASAGTGCHPIGVAASWNGSASGHFAESGHLTYPYLLAWTVRGAAAVTFEAHATSHASYSPAPSTLTLLLVELAAGALGAVGLVALVLGLFLRRGVYQGPAALVSRSADDAEAVAAEVVPGPGITGPRTAPPDGGSVPPPPEPPAHGR